MTQALNLPFKTKILYFSGRNGTPPSPSHVEDINKWDTFRLTDNFDLDNIYDNE